MEFLTPDRHNASGHYHDPYTVAGARSILRRFRSDVIAMLNEMDADRQRYGPEAKTMLAQSPLRSKPYVAGAMKTMGLIEERPTPNGACAVILTQKAIDQIANLRKYL